MTPPPTATATPEPQRYGRQAVPAVHGRALLLAEGVVGGHAAAVLAARAEQRL
jgi:hypothetical protein